MWRIDGRERANLSAIVYFEYGITLVLGIRLIILLRPSMGLPYNYQFGAVIIIIMIMIIGLYSEDDTLSNIYYIILYKQPKLCTM